MKAFFLSALILAGCHCGGLSKLTPSDASVDDGAVSKDGSLDESLDGSPDANNLFCIFPVADGGTVICPVGQTVPTADGCGVCHCGADPTAPGGVTFGCSNGAICLKDGGSDSGHD